MPSKKGKRSKKTPRPRGGGVEKKVRRVLGVTRGPFDRSKLEKAQRATLVEVCRLLGLSGVSRLRKEKLVDRILQALAPGKARSAKKRTAKKTAPKSRPRAALRDEELPPAEEEAAPPAAPAPAPSLPAHLPEHYGEDRVRAMVVDPERLCVQWEVTEEARERIEEALGFDAWLNLRVYDTTGRLFDGTNAHGYFDQPVPDDARQWFLDVGRPRSEAFVEVGLKSPKDRFLRIARSGRVVFPAREAAPPREPRWLTVRSLPAEPSSGPERRRDARSSSREADGRTLAGEGIETSRWQIERPTSLGVEIVEIVTGERSEEVLLGSSARLVRGEKGPGGASELLLRGASERLVRGASGRR